MWVGKVGGSLKLSEICSLCPALLWSTPDPFPLGADHGVSGPESLSAALQWVLVRCFGTTTAWGKGERESAVILLSNFLRLIHTTSDGLRLIIWKIF